MKTIAYVDNEQGGSVTVSNVLNMAQFSSSQSSYNIQGGTLSASSAFIESATSAGGSVFIQFGGAVSNAAVQLPLLVVALGAFAVVMVCHRRTSFRGNGLGGRSR